MESIRILALCVAAAILYGIAHDQITARICVEYFTIFHPPVFHTQSPTLLAFGWGTIATWWVGVLLGVPLSIASRAGSLPKLSAHDLIRPIFLLLIVMAACAVASGVYGYLWAETPRFAAALIPESVHRNFNADLWAHTASYLSGIIGGLTVCGIAYRRRLRLNVPR
jgi:hypothetical protein